MLKKYHAQLRSMDKEIAFALPEDIPQLFKGIPLKGFAQLTLQEQDLYDNIKTFLPDMADIQTQISWTGNHGMALLNQSIAFIETMMNHIKANYTNEIVAFKVLDYGCGWGRLIRLLYKFFPYTNLYGVDAWEESLKLCYDLKVKANFGRIDELCNEIPFNTTFNLIYAFSVFTHLSKRAAIQALYSIRKSITEDGILILTIRPREYWL